jgi:hypothetical protein
MKVLQGHLLQCVVQPRGAFHEKYLTLQGWGGLLPKFDISFHVVYGLSAEWTHGLHVASNSKQEA